MPKKFSYLTFLLLILTILHYTNASDIQNGNFVYTIPYIRSFRPDLIEKSLGCNMNIVFSSFTHPEGLRDAANIIANPYLYGGVRCQPRDMYLKIFGYAQNYGVLTDSRGVADNIKRSINGKFRNVIVDWKNSEGNLGTSGDFLNSLINSLEETGVTVYVKLPASYLCKKFENKPFL